MGIFFRQLADGVESNAYHFVCMSTNCKMCAQCTFVVGVCVDVCMFCLQPFVCLYVCSFAVCLKILHQKHEITLFSMACVSVSKELLVKFVLMLFESI